MRSSYIPKENEDIFVAESKLILARKTAAMDKMDENMITYANDKETLDALWEAFFVEYRKDCDAFDELYETHVEAFQ